METSFTYSKSMRLFSVFKAAELHSELSDPTRKQILSRFYAYPGYMQVWHRSDPKWLRKGGGIIFPIISQWEILVAMTTTVLIQSAPKPYADFPPPH